MAERREAPLKTVQLPTAGSTEPGADAQQAMDAGDEDVVAKFKKYDTNGDGTLSFSEFRELVAGEGLSEYMAFVSFFMLDKNDDGRIDYKEFSRFAELVQTPRLQAPPAMKPPALKRLVTRLVGEPRYLNELVFDSAQTAGSHLGAFFHADNGEKFYVKFPGIPPIHGDDEKSKRAFDELMKRPKDFFQKEDLPDDCEIQDRKQTEVVRRQTKSEVLVSKLYAMVGVEAAVMRLVYVQGAEEDGPVGCWSRNQDYEDIGQRQMPNLPGLREGFAADAWLANWDVIGNGAPHELNLKRTKGSRAFRLDFGGCLQYRAQGSDKSTAGCPFAPDSVQEVVNLRRFNYPFQNVSMVDVRGGVERISAVTDEAIKGVVADVLGTDAAYRDTTIADILIGRKKVLEKDFPPLVRGQMKISSKRNTRFYTRVAKTFLEGAEGKEAVDVLTISALGNAIPIGVAVAQAMTCKDCLLGKITKVSTSFQLPSKKASIDRGCGQLLLVISRRQE